MTGAPAVQGIAAFTWTAAREQAAGLLAADERTDEEIAAAVGVAPRTVYYWKRRPEFAARVAELVRAAREQARAQTILSKEYRLAQLSERQRKMDEVLAARAAEHAGIPGGGTGLLVAEPKIVKVYDAAPRAARRPAPTSLADEGDDEGTEDDGQIAPTGRVVVLYAYKVDTALLAEMRNTEKQAAQELGEWTDKQDTTLNGSQEFIAAMMRWGTDGSGA